MNNVQKHKNCNSNYFIFYIFYLSRTKLKAWHVARMEMMKKVNRSFVGGRKGRGNLGDFGVDGSHIIKIYLKDMNCEDVCLVQLGRGNDH